MRDLIEDEVTAVAGGSLYPDPYPGMPNPDGTVPKLKPDWWINF